ncbi:hypothetical protein [Thiocapsa rosea]|uniref:hypothetical protein n=1 Tax=Thiocapsa rosea TaxID=69360 RepID=UPI0011C3AC45|nr:hypothetical protein [Thiocapsa rosea]
MSKYHNGVNAANKKPQPITKSAASLCFFRRLSMTLGRMTKLLLTACADIGSVTAGNFGWWSSDGQSGLEPSTLAASVAAALNSNRPVALGFECPLFVPLTEGELELTRARPGEGSRPWSAGAGCGALTTGLVQVAWVLRAIRASLKSPQVGYLGWEAFRNAQSGLFIWEAFVSGKSKASTHVADAQAAGEAFIQALPNPSLINAVVCSTQVYSLVGAAMLRTGWSQSPEVLAEACLVIKVNTDAA